MSVYQSNPVGVQLHSYVSGKHAAFIFADETEEGAQHTAKLH